MIHATTRRLFYNATSQQCHSLTLLLQLTVLFALHTHAHNIYVRLFMWNNKFSIERSMVVVGGGAASSSHRKFILRVRLSSGRKISIFAYKLIQTNAHVYAKYILLANCFFFLLRKKKLKPKKICLFIDVFNVCIYLFMHAHKVFYIWIKQIQTNFARIRKLKCQYT